MTKYVRVRNNGCKEISGVKVQILSADPAAINTAWRSITDLDQFVAEAENPNGTLVAAGGTELIGPFLWIPNAEEAQGDGHRCLLAAITADGDPLDNSQRFDAPNFNNVGQRNLRVSGCDFQLPNATSAPGTVELRLVTDAEVEGTATVELVMPFIQGVFDAWSQTLGVELRQEGGNLVARVRLRDITLPAFTLNPGVVLNLSLRMSTPPGNQTRFVRLDPRFNGAPAAGFSCFARGQVIPT